MKNNGYTILIADDSKIDVELLTAGIACEGRDLVSAYSGREALSVIEENKPDLILLDVMMPDMDGYEVCKLLKQNTATRHIPIIFLTSLGDSDHITMGLELGAVDYIMKPYNLTEVNARIKNHLALQKGHRQSLELLKGFANSISDVALLIHKSGEILEFFGDCKKYFPKITSGSCHQNIKDVLPEFLGKQFISALKTISKEKDVFEFETELVIEGIKHVLQVSILVVDHQYDNEEVIGIKFVDITNRRTAERKVDLTYEYQKRSRFFNSVLTGGYSEEQQKQLLSIYGIESQNPLYCYVISTSIYDVNLANASDIRSSIGEWLLEKGYGWIWNSNFGIGMLMQYPSNVNDFEKVAHLLKESLKIRFPNINMCVGIANSNNALNFKQLYYDALAALMMAIDKNEDFAVAQFPVSNLYEFIVHAIEHMDINRFIDHVLGKVKQHDLRNGSELLNTLEQLIVAPSIKAVAANLFIHPNTVLWRKQKIEEVLSVSLDDINTRTQINLAFKLIHIRDFTKKSGEIFSK